MKHKYSEVFTQKQYLKMIGANLINRFGDSLDAIAFSWIAYEITGSASWLAIIFGINAIPTIIFQPFMGALIEHLNKKKVMVFCDILRGVLVLITAILYLTHNLNPFLLAGFTFLMSTFESFRIPAGLAILPKILDKEYYTHGMSLSSSLSRISEIVGMALAGPIIALFGPAVSMLIDAITFFLSALIISFIKAKEELNKEFNLNITSYFNTLKEGFIYLKNAKVIFTICILGSIMALLFIPLNVLEVPYVNTVLKLGAEALSVIGISTILGMSLGSFIFPQVKEKFTNRILFIMSGIMVGATSILYVAISLIDSITIIYAFLILISFIFGICGSILTMVVNVAFMAHIEEEYIARAGSIFNALATLAMPVGSFVISGVAAILSITQIMTLFGFLTILLFVSMLFIKILHEL